MFEFLKLWLLDKRRRQKLVVIDAHALIRWDERRAYYEAHRRAMRARCQGEAKSFVHWTRTANEIAKRSPKAEMDLDALKAIVDTERRKCEEESLKPSR